jgi:glycosyltransferase involved in cell wall biosynthesis
MNRPPSVLLVTKGLDLGGIERIVVDLALGFSDRGLRVAVAVVNERRSRLIPQLEAAGVEVFPLGGTDRVGLRALWRLGGLLRRERFDVVHVHGPLPAAAVRILPKGGAVVVTTSHTVWRSLRWPTRVLWRLTAGSDDATLAVSSAVAESLPTAVSGRTVVLPHGVDVDAIAIARSVSVPRSSDDVLAVCVASHRDVKNYPNLLRAVSMARQEAPSLRLLSVGDGPDLERHRQLAVDLGLHDAVRFVPSTLDVLTSMASADLLVVASDFEGQPLVVMEAMALGLPVVATSVGRVPELITPSAGRIVPPGDSAALAEALVELVQAPELRRKLGEHARASSAAWTLHEVVDTHLRLYGSLLEDRRLRSA